MPLRTGPTTRTLPATSGAAAGAHGACFGATVRSTRATRDPRFAQKYRDLTADGWDRWFFDHGEVGLVGGVSIACATMAILGHWVVGGWIGVVVGVAAGLVASGLHASYYLLAGGAI